MNERPVRHLWLAVLLGGCASFARVASDIPATATPARSARYLQSRDLEYFAAGMVADEAMRLVFKGPRRCGGHSCGTWSPAARIGSVLVLVLVHREVSPDYRESGALFTLAGSWVWEVVRCVASNHCRSGRRE